MVSQETPDWIAASTVRRTARDPSRCPAIRGRPRDLAQRPLPSMMMATWPGTLRPADRVPIGETSASTRDAAVLTAWDAAMADDTSSSDTKPGAARLVMTGTLVP